MVIAAMVIAIAILMVFVVPGVRQFLRPSRRRLPLPTRIIIGTSNFTAEWWWVIGLAQWRGARLRAWIRTEAGRYRWDRTKLHFPVVGKILFDGHHGALSPAPSR
jgi:MSHA biogenesis protein MshG